MNGTPIGLAAALPAVVAPPQTAAAAPDHRGDEFARCLDAAADEPAQRAPDKRPDANAPQRPRREAQATRDARDTRDTHEATPSASPEAADAAPTDAAKIGVEPTQPEATASEPAAGQPGADAADSEPALPSWALALGQATAPAADEASATGSDVAQAVLAAVAEGRPRASAAHEALALRPTPADAASAGTHSAPHAPSSASSNVPSSASSSVPSSASSNVPSSAPFTMPEPLAAKTRDDALPSAAVPSPASFAPTPVPAAPTFAARALDTALPWSGHIAASMDSPAFAPALAGQVRWLVRDGVQRAQLSLNPPEMGPLSVQISVHDGRHARIDFMADMAATRHAIEQSLPVLAAALDESGLKLSGGGVHDGRPSTGQQQNASDTTRRAPWHADRPDPRSGELDGTLPVPHNVLQAARGLVDLVA